MMAWRKPDWTERLDQYLSKPHTFCWSNSNCALFVGSWIAECTGVDYTEQFRGPKTKAAMLNRMLELGFNTVEEIADRFTDGRVDVTLARRGDTVSYAVDGYPALGICNGSHSAFLPEGGNKVIWVPTLQCKLAWRI